MNSENSQEPQSEQVPQWRPTSRRNGKVARLPKVVRDRVNVMIQDGVPYLGIIEKLGPIRHLGPVG